MPARGTAQKLADARAGLSNAARFCSAQWTASARTVNRHAASSSPFWKI
jgi:hypothetical protein